MPLLALTTVTLADGESRALHPGYTPGHSGPRV